MSIRYNTVINKILYCGFYVALFLTKNIVSAKYLSDDTPSEWINEFKVNDISQGVYSFRFKTPTNIEREERGHVDDEGNLVVDGFYSYTDPDGKLQYVSYRADKDGYHTFKIPEFPVAAAPAFDPNAVATLLG